MSPELLPPPGSGTWHFWLTPAPILPCPPVAMRVLPNLSGLAANWGHLTQRHWFLGSAPATTPNSSLLKNTPYTLCSLEIHFETLILWVK